MFFSLQTTPHYIASLTRQVTLKEIDGEFYLLLPSLPCIPWHSLPHLLTYS